MGPSSPRQEKTGVPSVVQSGSESKLWLILPFCSPFYFWYVAFLRPCQFRDVIKVLIFTDLWEKRCCVISKHFVSLVMMKVGVFPLG